MKDENDSQGAQKEMKTKPLEAVAGLAAQLVASATITGLPDKAFFRNFTARRRREIVYYVDAHADGIGIRLEVHGSGKMKARIDMKCVSIEDGAVEVNDHHHILSWADNGHEVILATHLDHRHLENHPQSEDVISAFIRAIDVQTHAYCPGGYPQWKAMMQLFTQRIAREKGVPIELVALLPFPTGENGGVRLKTEFEISNIEDHDSPVRIDEYGEELAHLDEETTPEAMSLMLLPPGYLVKRRHQEIFHAE